MKEKIKTFCKENKVLLIIASILNATFSVLVILSLCGINIAQLVVENEALNIFDKFIINNNLTYFLYAAMLSFNCYFIISISCNDYGKKPILISILWMPVFYLCQFYPQTTIASFLLPLCVVIIYDFKLSNIIRFGCLTGIVTLYQYLMQIAKLSLFKFEYLSTSVINYLVLSIDLYIVYLMYYAISKTIYKNKNKEVK